VNGRRTHRQVHARVQQRSQDPLQQGGRGAFIAQHAFHVAGRAGGGGGE
jgi:hypothetical protein